MASNKTVKKASEKDDYITNRVLAVFAAAAVMLFALSYLIRGWDRSASHNTASVLTTVLFILGLLGAAAGIWWYISAVKKGTFKPTSVFNGIFVAGVCIVLALSCLLVMYSYVVAKRILCVFFPAAAILFLIYSVYQRDFFMICLLLFPVTGIFWLFSRTANRGVALLALIVGLVLCAVGLALFLMTAKNKGILKLGKNKFSLFTKDSSKSHFIPLYAITAAILIAAFIFTSPLAKLAIIASIAYLFICVIYYTVKLM